MPSVNVDVIGKCSILVGVQPPPNNTAPLVADPYPATGRPLPAASAAAYAQACATSPPASPASATSTTSAPNRAAAPACAPGTPPPPSPSSRSRASSAPTSAAASCASSAPTAASAAVGCKSYALAELGFVFLVEDIERRQADVSDFLLTESNYRKRCGLLQRYIRCRCSCVCAACHRQGHSGGSQYR